MNIEFKRWVRPLAGGAIGALGILGLDLGLVTLSSGLWEHAVSLLREDRWFVAPITLGFGTQVGLYAHLRYNLGAHRGGAMPAATGGTATAAMVACCAHHVTDVLPLLGLSTVTVFLAEFKVPFMIVGILSNLAGIAVMLRLIRGARRHVPAGHSVPARRGSQEGTLRRANKPLVE